MTTESADEVRGSATRGETNSIAPGIGATSAAAALFLILFWPILAVRFHFYLEKPRYSHCVLLPAVSALWIFDRWATIRTVPRSLSVRGFALLVASVALFVYARLISFHVLQHLAMLCSLAALVLTLFGAKLLRALAFPLGYLVLMVPLHPKWDDDITVPLQSFATGIAERFFDALGWVVVRDGNILQLPRLKLLVEEGCSGVHSLYALIALAVAFVFFVERPWWLRVTLIAAALPIAVLANAIRVSITGVLAYKVDPSYAQGVSHQTAGMIVFGIGVALLLAVDWCLKPDAEPEETDAAASA